MKIIKRSQVALLSLTFMIMIAGYINYKYDENREKDLGKSVYVSSSDIYLYDNASSVSVYTEEGKNSQNMYNIKNSASISKYKSDREDNYSKRIEEYTNCISSNSNNNEIALKYQEKLDAVNLEKYKVALAEQMLKTKNYTDIAVLPNEDEIIVVTKGIILTEKDVTNIQEVITTCFNITAQNLTIMQE